MIKFNSATLGFKLCGLSLLCLLLFLFIFALPPFQAGTWFNTEPAMLAMFILAALCSLWLGEGIWRGFLVIERPIHPLVYGLLAWAGLQFLTLPFAANPYRSWLGVPQTGEGAAWQIMLVLFTFLAMPLWEAAIHKKILLLVGLASLCIMTYLHFDLGVFCAKYANYTENNVDTPANFPDYLAFIAAFLWLAYASVPSIRTPARHFWMVTICSFAIFTTSNHTASLFIFPMLIAMGIALLSQLARRKLYWLTFIIKQRKLWKILAIAGIFLPLSFVAISQQPDFFPCKNESFASRAVFNQAAISAIIQEPHRLITGTGWGGFSSDMFKYGMVDGLYGFKGGIYQPNCMWLAGTVFHPHNQGMAALLATGFIGFAVFMLLPILAFLPLRRSLFWWCVPVLIGISAVGALWFALPQVLPFQALAFAALCAGRKACGWQTMPTPKFFRACLESRCSVTKKRSFSRILPQCTRKYMRTKFLKSKAFCSYSRDYKQALTAIFAIFFVLFAASAYEQKQIISYGERLAYIMGEDPNQVDIVEWLAQDISRGSDSFITAAQHYAGMFADKANSGMLTDRDKDWYRNFLETTKIAASDNNADIRFAKLEVELSMLPFRLMQKSPLDVLKPQIKEHLADAIFRISEKAPQREDFIAPFLMSLDGFTGGNLAKQQEILEKIISIAPNHRSALWLLGGIYQHSPATIKQGTEMKTRAGILGVERVFPVTKQELNE